MTMSLHEATNEQLGESLAMILVGAEKSGKSQLAATAPGPVLFIDYDMRAASLAGKKDVYAISCADTAGKQPSAFSDSQGIITKLETNRKLSSLGFKSEAEVSTIVFDSIATMSDAARRYALYSNDDISYKVSIPGRVYKVPKNWHGWGIEQDMVTTLILQARSIPKMNVIVTLHECMEEDERSTQENPIFTGRIEVYPRRYNSLLKYFNEVWRLKRPKGQVPTIEVNPDGNFTKAANSLGLDKVESLNITDIIAKARQKRLA